MIRFGKTAGNLELSLGLPSLFQSLGFGGLLGLLLTYLISLRYPALISGVEMKYVLVFGGAFGTSVHRLIDSLIVKGMLGSLRRRISYYATVAELEINRRRNLVESETYTSIKQRLDYEYFLGVSQSKPKLLSESREGN